MVSSGPLTKGSQAAYRNHGESARGGGGTFPVDQAHQGWRKGVHYQEERHGGVTILTVRWGWEGSEGGAEAKEGIAEV